MAAKVNPDAASGTTARPSTRARDASCLQKIAQPGHRFIQCRQGGHGAKLDFQFIAEWLQNFLETRATDEDFFGTSICLKKSADQAASSGFAGSKSAA